MADDFKPSTREDNDDLHALPGQFRAFAREMTAAVELLANRILPKLERMEATFLDVIDRVCTAERAINDHAARLDRLEARRKPKRRKAKP